MSEMTQLLSCFVESVGIWTDIYSQTDNVLPVENLRKLELKVWSECDLMWNFIKYKLIIKLQHIPMLLMFHAWIRTKVIIMMIWRKSIWRLMYVRLRDKTRETTFSIPFPYMCPTPPSYYLRSNNLSHNGKLIWYAISHLHVLGLTMYWVMLPRAYEKNGRPKDLVALPLVSILGISQNQSAISISQNQSASHRINQHLSESISISQTQPASLRINKHQLAFIRINQHQLESISISQNQSASIRINQHLPPLGKNFQIIP